jgi:hypothetical protein
MIVHPCLRVARGGESDPLREVVAILVVIPIADIEGASCVAVARGAVHPSNRYPRARKVWPCQTNTMKHFEIIIYQFLH